VLAAIRSAAVLGIDAYDVTVETDAANGLPQFTVVGLPAGAVRESRERVSAALVNSGFTLPPRRLTVNLAPADVRKEGTSFDLPIALGILVATGQLSSESVAHVVVAGELVDVWAIALVVAWLVLPSVDPHSLNGWWLLPLLLAALGLFVFDGLAEEARAAPARSERPQAELGHAH
jgi:hypothetical protein